MVDIKPEHAMIASFNMHLILHSGIIQKFAVLLRMQSVKKQNKDGL